MTKQENMMEKFDYLLGSWDMEYINLKGSGTGTFKRALDNKYIFFDYSASSPTGQKGEAHAIFAWDEKAKVYRYWWFENSGSFLSATCDFINDETLFLSWHDTLLIQTFKKDGPNKMILQMEQPDSEGKFELILEVIFTRK